MTIYYYNCYFQTDYHVHTYVGRLNLSHGSCNNPHFFPRCICHIHVLNVCSGMHGWHILEILMENNI